MIIILFSFSGCKRYVYIHDRYPVYETPPKSELPKISWAELSELDSEIREKILKSVKDLKLEAAQLRAILDSYNDYANRKNDEYDLIFEQ